MESIDAKIGNVSAANVTDDGEACPKSWYVARVQMHCEKKTSLMLNALGIENFLPTQQEIHQWSDRKKKIDKLLIPMMVFVRATNDALKEIERLPNVYGMLKAPGNKGAAIIPDIQIETFRYMIGQSESGVTIEPLTINKGDEVRIIRGGLKNLEGFVVEADDKKSLVAIVIDYIGCASVKINRSDLELIKK